MLARRRLHGDEDDCQRPVQELFTPDPKDWHSVPPSPYLGLPEAEFCVCQNQHFW